LVDNDQGDATVRTRKQATSGVTGPALSLQAPPAMTPTNPTKPMSANGWPASRASTPRCEAKATNEHAGGGDHEIGAERQSERGATDAELLERMAKRAPRPMNKTRNPTARMTRRFMTDSRRPPRLSAREKPHRHSGSDSPPDPPLPRQAVESSRATRPQGKPPSSLCDESARGAASGAKPGRKKAPEAIATPRLGIDSTRGRARRGGNRRGIQGGAKSASRLQRQWPIARHRKAGFGDAQ
jgi:hypothetical protein